MSTISFVIPVFRNRGSIRATYAQITEMLGAMHPDHDYRFVFVDDGSDDGSIDEILGICREDAKVQALRFSRNFGQVPAIIAGLRATDADATVIMSADLQDPVAMISEMIGRWQAGNEIVICYRASREDSKLAEWTSRVFYKLIQISNPRMPTGGFDYVLLDAKPRRIMADLRERNRFFQGDVLWLGFATQFIPYHRQERKIGKSQWTLAKKIKYFIDGLLNTSYLPIRFMSSLGIVTALLGFLYAVVVVTARLTGNMPFLGYAPLMTVILVIGGLNMFMLGVIGEYVWRIYDETRGRPLYLIKDRYNDGEGAPEDALASASAQAPDADAAPSPSRSLR